MSGEYKLIKSFSNVKGLDLRSSDLTRSSQHASDLLNQDYRKTGALNKRKGQHAKHDSIGGAGLGVYANIDITTGDITEELLTVDSNLHKLIKETLTVTYTGTTSARMSMFYDTVTSSYKFTLINNNVTVLSFSLGIGINEPSVVSISNLLTAINAIADFSAVASNNTTVAAFIDIIRDVTVSSTGTIINYNSFKLINTTLTNPLSVTQSHKNDESFINASFANLQNVIYLATGYDELYKYDGQTFYRAGVPIGVTPLNVVASGTGTINNSDLKYITTYVQLDNKGNVIEGIESLPSVGINAANASSITLDVTHIKNNTGFNTNCGVVKGAQAVTNTLILDNGTTGNHTLKAGDTAYFFDNVTNDYITRNITSVTTTTITVAGSAVTVNDNINISNNLRIAIYRNQSAGSTFSLVSEIPNNSFVSSVLTHTDTLLDASLGANYILPIKQHGLPPKGRYLTVFQNTLIIGGNPTNVNSVTYSDTDGAEFFPAGDNSFLVETDIGDKITGLSKNNNALFIFKNNSIHSLTGNLPLDQFRVDIVYSGDIGCVSHHTISEVKGELYFLSDKGVYAISQGSNKPDELSFNIEPIFKDSDFNFKSSKSIAINWFSRDKYVIVIPSESIDSSGNRYTNLLKTRTLVYDYSRQAWLPWDNIDAQGGMVLYNNELYVSERRLGTATGLIENYLYKFLERGDELDYIDHNKAINYISKTHWEALNEPDVFKKFIRLKVQSLDTSINDFESDSFKLNVEIQSDYNDSATTIKVLDFSSSNGWGEFAWGTSPWGSVRSIKLQTKIKKTKALSIRVIYSNNNIYENILISGWTLETALPYKIRSK